MLGAVERLKIAREVRDAVLSMGAAHAVTMKIMHKRKAESLRAVLLGRGGSGLADLDLFATGPTRAALLTHWQGLAQADEETRGMAADYLSIIVPYLDQIDRKTGGGSLGTFPLYEVRAASRGHTPQYRRAQFQRLHDAGSAAVRVAKDLATAHAELKEVEDKFSAMAREAKEVFQRVRSEITKRNAAAIKEIHDAFGEHRIDVPELTARMRAIQDEMDAEARRACPEVPDELRQKREALQAVIEGGAAALKSSVLDRSPISHDESSRWAAAQTVTRAAVNRLRKMGYEVAQMRADMAEFYRLTGGRLASVTIASSGGKRANAQGIHGHSTSVINMGSRFDKRVLFHEMAHHLEADPVLLAATRGFLEKRRTSSRPRSLRALTGNFGYRPSEVAYDDSWFDAYVGKEYQEATEVLSMGMESFCDPKTLGNRLVQDPEMFALMVGVTSTRPDPLFGVVQTVFRQVAEAEKEAADAEEVEAQSAVKRLSAGVELTPGASPPNLEWIVYSYKGKYVGFYRDFHVYEAQGLRDPQTRRRKSGFLIVRAEEDEGRRSATWTPVFGGMQEVRAAARAWELNGRPVSLTDSATLGRLEQGVAHDR